MKPIEIVTNKIIENLENGVIPWNKPWSGGVPPMRVSVMKPYRGANALLLNLTTTSEGYSNNYYGTYKQWQALGNQVKKGEKANPAMFWKFFEDEVNMYDETKTRPPVCRYYNVFNYDQTEGDYELPTVKSYDFNPVKKAEEIVANMPNCPPIMHGPLGAFYSIDSDTVTVPMPERFEQSEEYYATLFHELVHSTGHKSRLSRFSDESVFRNGDEYSKEELIAEIGASTLCNMAGIDQPIIENSSAYIAHWLKTLKDDRQFLVSAASQAQSAVEYIGGDDADNDV